MRLAQRVEPFSEESLHNEGIVYGSTEVLNAVLGLVEKTVRTSDMEKLSPFQESVAMYKASLTLSGYKILHIISTHHVYCTMNTLRTTTAMEKHLCMLIL